jgi:zinc transport system ATP-binding protein
MTIIEIKNLDFAYGGETVLEGVNLTVRQKDFIAIIGPNGGGKTTLLKLMLGLLSPVAGTVRVDGKSPQRLPMHRLRAAECSHEQQLSDHGSLTWC